MINVPVIFSLLASELHAVYREHHLWYDGTQMFVLHVIIWPALTLGADCIKSCLKKNQKNKCRWKLQWTSVWKINPLKKEINLNYTQRLSSYHTVNTLRLGYKNQSVNAVLGNNCWLFWDPYKAQKLHGQNVELLNAKTCGTYSSH
jgi:hypothetical protein